MLDAGSWFPIQRVRGIVRTFELVLPPERIETAVPERRGVRRVALLRGQRPTTSSRDSAGQ